MFSNIFKTISEQVDDISKCSDDLKKEIEEIVNEHNIIGGSYNDIMYDIRFLIYDYYRNKTIKTIKNKYNITSEEALKYFEEYYITEQLYICTNWIAFFKK